VFVGSFHNSVGGTGGEENWTEAGRSTSSTSEDFFDVERVSRGMDLEKRERCFPGGHTRAIFDGARSK